MIKFLIRACCIVFALVFSLQSEAQFITTTDNANSSFSGTPDGDLDVTVNVKTNGIEFSINTTGMPSEQLQLAINAYNVNVDDNINVLMNGSNIGKLNGQSRKWVISMLDVPLKLWVNGVNKIELIESGGDDDAYIKVDWGQLIVNGGTKNGAQLNSFKLDKFNSYEEGFFNIVKWRLYNNLDISVTGGSFSTQLQLIERNILWGEKFEDVSYGTIAASEVKTMTLDYLNNNLSKNYLCRAFLVNNTTNEIVDWDEFTFHHEYLEGPDPFSLKFENSIKVPTQENVTINCTEFNSYKNLAVKHVLLPDNTTTTNTAFSYVAANNGDYSFKVVLNDNSYYTFSHTVSNIDRIAPEVTRTGDLNITLVEGSTYSDPGATAFDNYDGNITMDVFVLGTVNTDVPKKYSQSYHVYDRAGNGSKWWVRNVYVINKPLEVNTTSPNQSLSEVEFTGNLLFLGTTPISQHGFVWSLLPNPTLDVCLGSSQLGVATAKKSMSSSSSSLEMGASYHVRSYATNSEGTVYGGDVYFTYNGINYGTLDIENATYSATEGGTVSIKINRTGGTEGSITVDYTTLNGNALAGSNFTAISGTLTFAAGVSSKTIIVGTSSNASYTGNKQFYFKIKNVSNGAINRDQCAITITDGQTKPANYNLTKQTLLAGTVSNPGNKTYYNIDVDVSSYAELIATNQLRAAMHGEKYSENESGLVTDDLSQLTFYHGGNNVASISNNNDSWESLNDTRMVANGISFVRITRRGVAQGLNDDTPNVSFRNLYVTLTDVVAPTIKSISSNANTYIFNNKIYIAVTMSERVKVSNTTITLNTGNTSSGTATCIAGGETDCLLFEYSVREGDNTSAIVVSGISGITDYQPNTINAGALPITLSGVGVNGILPVVNLIAQDNLNDWRNSHAVKINITGSDSRQFAWSKSTSMPGIGWTSFSSGAIQTISSGDGAWYLHVYAACSNGNSKYVVSPVVNLDNIAPDLSLTPSITDWTNGNVTISASQTDAHPGSITPSTSSVSTNGDYSYTATDLAGNQTSKTISVSNIDKTVPVISIENNGSGGNWIDVAQTVVTVVDDASGITSFQYLWNASSATPTSGWLTYSGSSTFLSDNTIGTRYLHIKAGDVAGNIAYLNSNAFRIDNEKPTLNLTCSNPTSWVNTDVIVTISAAKTSGQQLVKVILPDNTELTASAGIASGTFTITENGLYWFTAIDAAGNITEEKLLVTKLDKEAPVLNYSVSSSDWTMSNVTVRLTLDDENSPLYNSEGIFTGYGSSGGVEFKEGAGEFQSYSSEIIKVIESNTNLVFEARDQLGNSIVQTIEIANIDKTAPAVNTDNHDYDWQTSNFTVPLTFADDVSGIEEELYALTTSTSTPSAYTNYSSPISISTEGIFYLHYKAQDLAGNIKTGYFGPYKLDKIAPVGFSASVSNVTSNSIKMSGSSSDATSGIHASQSYQFAKDGTYGYWGAISSDSYTGLLPNKSYAFKMKAQDNAGLTTETAVVTKSTLAIDPTVVLSSNQSTQLNFSVTHDGSNSVIPACNYELKLLGAGSAGANVATKAWTTNTSISFTGLTAGTHYELWVTTRNNDSFINAKFKAIIDAVTNRPPVANNENYTVYKNHVLTAPGTGVLTNDTDPDGNSITAVLQTGPSEAQGTLSLAANGSFTFTPKIGFTGLVIFTYKANDGYVNSDNSATVTISVVTPTWNGTGLHTTVANWNGNEIPEESDNVIIQSGTMNVNSVVSYSKMSIGAAQVLVQSEGNLSLSECNYSGAALKAENGGQVVINGNVSSGADPKVRINSGVRIKSGIKLSVEER